MNIKEIIEAISTKLYSLVDGIHIYTFNSEQNLKTPCFIIQPIDISEQDLLGTMQVYQVKRDLMFSIVFISETDQWDLRLVTEEVIYNLRFIETEKGYSLETHNREFKIVDETSSVITFEIHQKLIIGEDKSPYFKHLEKELINSNYETD